MREDKSLRISLLWGSMKELLNNGLNNLAFEKKNQ